MGPSVCRPLDHTVDRGPWTSTCDWLKAYVKSELSGLLNDPEKYRESRKGYNLDNGNPPYAYHVAWLKKRFLRPWTNLSIYIASPPR